MTEDTPLSPDERAYRRGFKQKSRRDDLALDLFAEASASLDDPDRVDRVLARLARLYNPLVNGPVVSLEARRRIMEALGAGRSAEAAAVLDRCYSEYAPLPIDESERKPFA